ncbi:MAG TPA: hypothetical protein PK760_09095, partial [Flavobacteriales bacterium]|nr:hypothetical protein [Flavobacteriales bacterium]
MQLERQRYGAHAVNSYQHRWFRGYHLRGDRRTERCHSSSSTNRDHFRDRRHGGFYHSQCVHCEQLRDQLLCTGRWTHRRWYRFLNEQLDDLKRSRDELLGIIKDVDERVQQVFAEAYADTEREFERIFARLFPGGEGRLLLTNPDDMLTTGIEVEARPPGKKVKRLSLLSGGEQALTAMAFLVALFKARPSPFYIMDEVEAALDDVNLGRLLAI